MWIRLMISVFSVTAITLFSYQAIEIFHAYVEFFKSKNL